jgi:hypothetical protein
MSRLDRLRVGRRQDGDGRHGSGLLGGRLQGRRLGDPVDLPASDGAQPVRGRLAAVSVRASLVAGAWVGAVIGLVLGAVLGAIVVWFAGAVLDWQRDLSFTFGVTRRLLPFGDQLGLLRDIQVRWWLVIIGSALAVAAVAAAFGALLGGILAAAYNRSPRHALVVVELPSRIVAAPAPTADSVDEAATAAAQPIRDEGGLPIRQLKYH